MGKNPTEVWGKTLPYKDRNGEQEDKERAFQDMMCTACCVFYMTVKGKADLR
jgi:hypothetical protein